MAKYRIKRSTAPKDKLRKRYVELGQLAALQQVRKDARLLDAGKIAVGPFARLDVSAVAARRGKSRGAINNLFGNQARFQAETMALAMNASHLIAGIRYPDPADFASADAWADAFFAGQSARGPVHGAKPAVNYAFLWVLWMSTLPYAMWSESTTQQNLEEHVLWLKQMETVFERALAHFGLSLKPGVTITDLACASASVIEGVWINQCLTTLHTRDPNESIATLLRRSGLMLWRGAVE
ncbi:MAG: hypothetical protein ACKVP5_19470 [Aestuariivirga sp.]